MRIQNISHLVIVLLLATCPSGTAATFVYVNNDIQGPNSVSAFAVSSTGVLTQIAHSPFATGGTGSGGGTPFAANRIRVVRDTLYVSNTVSQDISAFSIDPNTGELSPVAGSPFTVGSPVVGPASNPSLAATPDGKFLYAANAIGGLYGFSIGANGALSPLASFPVIAVAAVAGMTTTGDGKFLALAQDYLGQVTMFAIDPATGKLTAVAGSPFATPSGTFGPIGISPGTFGPAGVDCNCAGNLLFVGSEIFPFVAVYSIDATGVLAQINGSPFQGSSFFVAPSVPLLSPDDTKLFVSSWSFTSSVDVFTVAPSGALTLVAGSPFGDPHGYPVGMGTDPTGNFLFAGSLLSPGTLYPAVVSSFNIAANGVLSSPSTAVLPSGAAPRSLAVFPPKICCPAPVISGAAASPVSLWPPTQQLVPVTIDYSVAETCPGTCVLTVASSESGGTVPEWEVIDSHHVMLMADRLGDGPGRVYTITITCTSNVSGLSSAHSVTVVVPHDQS